MYTGCDPKWGTGLGDHLFSKFVYHLVWKGKVLWLKTKTRSRVRVCVCIYACACFCVPACVCAWLCSRICVSETTQRPKSLGFRPGVTHIVELKIIFILNWPFLRSLEYSVFQQRPGASHEAWSLSCWNHRPMYCGRRTQSAQSSENKSLNFSQSQIKNEIVLPSTIQTSS